MSVNVVRIVEGVVGESSARRSPMLALPMLLNRLAGVVPAAPNSIFSSPAPRSLPCCDSQILGHVPQTLVLASIEIQDPVHAETRLVHHGGADGAVQFTTPFWNGASLNVSKIRGKLYTVGKFWRPHE